jgi:hypothetical protein
MAHLAGPSATSCIQAVLLHILPAHPGRPPWPGARASWTPPWAAAELTSPLQAEPQGLRVSAGPVKARLFAFGQPRGVYLNKQAKQREAPAFLIHAPPWLSRRLSGPPAAASVMTGHFRTPRGPWLAPGGCMAPPLPSPSRRCPSGVIQWRASPRTPESRHCGKARARSPLKIIWPCARLPGWPPCKDD